MFANDKTIDNITDLYKEVKEYIELQKEYITLDLVEKLTILLSAIVLGFILMCLGMVVLFYLSFTVVYLISPLVGGLAGAFAIITGALLTLSLFIYYKRQALIILPMTQFIASVLLKDSKNDKNGYTDRT